MKPISAVRRTVCLLTALCLTGCGDIVKDMPAVEEAVFRQYYNEECSTLNYLKTNMYKDTAISANVIDCLVDYDSYGNVMPGLAESWESSEDKTEWTFHIRKGVKWVDSLGVEYAEVKADDWVAAAEYVNNAFNESYCQYVYSSGAVIHGAEEYYQYTKYMKDSHNGTYPNDENGHPFIIPPETKAEDIGVTAPDDHTLVYKLDAPCSFFLSLLSFTPFMPVNRQFLESEGKDFGHDNKSILYNGAFVLSLWSPLEQRIMTKNVSYWDADKVYIDRIEEIYNSDAYEVQAEMYLKGEVDRAQLDREELDEWMQNDTRKSQIHPARPDNSYSYFYCFNFSPNYSDLYEPENWRLAVNNENFRKAVAAAVNKNALVEIYDPYDSERLVSNTLTPAGFVSVNGKDYTSQTQFADISGKKSFDPNFARRYAAQARGELGQAGAKFPIKMIVPYNPAVLGWDTETALIETQLEETLGSDFIDVIPQEGSENEFLGSVRESGNFSFLKCNWGADYTDPETFTDPFGSNAKFCFWHMGSTQTANVFNEWVQLVNAAHSTATDTAERYSRFADAEKLLIDHAIAVPVSIECSDGYILSKLDQYESEYAPCGIVRQRFKLMHLYASSYGIEDSERRFAKWQSKRQEMQQQ